MELEQARRETSAKVRAETLFWRNISRTFIRMRMTNNPLQIFAYLYTKDTSDLWCVPGSCGSLFSVVSVYKCMPNVKKCKNLWLIIGDWKSGEVPNTKLGKKRCGQSGLALIHRKTTPILWAVKGGLSTSLTGQPLCGGCLFLLSS